MSAGQILRFVTSALQNDTKNSVS